MPYHKRMKAPRPEFTTSRLNVGGYGVMLTHRTVAPDPMGRAWDDLFRNDPRLSSVPSNGRLRLTPKGLEVSVFIRGRVQADGMLTVEREPWAARHYRRAVMGGAGVYRMGLWAFLAARRRGLQFTVPEPGASIEPHTVRVRGFADIPTCVIEGGWGDGPARRVRKLMKFCTLDEGAVSADGALSIEAGPWFERQLRQARMKAAGVYLAGLWALFASGHTREHLQGTQSYANTSSNLDAWAERGHAPPPPPSEVLVSMSYRQIKRAYGLPVANSVADAAREVARQVAEALSPVEVIKHIYKTFTGDIFSGGVFDELCGARVRLDAVLSSVTEAVRAAYSTAALNYLPRGKASRAARRELHAQKRAVLRLLRRMVPRRAVHRPTLRTPRPLYAQATPPSAPLAPPAL